MILKQNIKNVLLKLTICGVLININTLVAGYCNPNSKSILNTLGCGVHRAADEMQTSVHTAAGQVADHVHNRYNNVRQKLSGQSDIQTHANFDVRMGETDNNAQNIGNSYPEQTDSTKIYYPTDDDERFRSQNYQPSRPSIQPYFGNRFNNRNFENPSNAQKNDESKITFIDDDDQSRFGTSNRKIIPQQVPFNRQPGNQPDGSSFNGIRQNEHGLSRPSESYTPQVNGFVGARETQYGSEHYEPAGSYIPEVHQFASTGTDIPDVVREPEYSPSTPINLTNNTDLLNRSIFDGASRSCPEGYRTVGTACRKML